MSAPPPPRYGMMPQLSSYFLSGQVRKPYVAYFSLLFLVQPDFRLGWSPLADAADR